MPDSPTPEETLEIAELLAAGRKIEAIKVYRSATGKGLKETKEFIEALVPKLIEQDPEKYKALSVHQGSGCATAVLASLSIAAAATALVQAIC